MGHGLRNDLEVLMIKHPKSNIRDTSRYENLTNLNVPIKRSSKPIIFVRYKFFRSVVNGATPSLKRLAQQFLGISIQSGEHSSVRTSSIIMKVT